MIRPIRNIRFAGELMIRTSRSVRVKSLAGKVWDMVLDLVDHPLKYMPLAISAEPVKRTGGTARSVIQVSGFKLKELVRIDEAQRVVTYIIEDSPDWAGYREVAVSAGPKGDRISSSNLTVSFEWTPLSAKAKALKAQGLDGIIEASLVRWKMIAEERK